MCDTKQCYYNCVILTYYQTDNGKCCHTVKGQSQLLPKNKEQTKKKKKKKVYCGDKLFRFHICSSIA